MEETRGGRASARKIFDMGARVDRETPGYTVREECKRNRLRVKTGKRTQRGQNGWKGRVQDTDRMLETKQKEQREEGERSTTRGMGVPVKKWKD
jgi:hypothetical protein